MANDKTWNEQRVLITGTTAGLGRALALHLAEQGARVAAVGRDPDKLARLAHPRIHPILADVTDKRATYRIAGEATTALGGIDVLINNASYLGVTPLRLLVDSDCEDLEKAHATNVLAPFRLAKAVLPGMLLQQRGLIVNLSSDAAQNAYSGWGAYAISKAGVDHLSRVFDVELKNHGVRVLALDPGDMNTAMHHAAIPDADVNGLRDPAIVARELATFLLKSRNADRSRYAASEWRSP